MQTAGAYPYDVIHLQQAWTAFTNTGEILPSVRPLIAAAWKRCAPRLNPHLPIRPTRLSPRVLPLTLRQHAALRAIARPIMEDTYEFLEGTGTLLVLTDTTHCVLEMLGDPVVADDAARMGLEVGIFTDEGHTGNTALSLAMQERYPVQVVGPEHFARALHGTYGAAAPIFEPDGSPIAVLGLVGPLARYGPHALGVAVASARAIENQLRTEALLREANTHATGLNATINAISEGVLAWTMTGLISHFNQQAGALLGLEPTAVLGRPVHEHLILPLELERAAAHNTPVTDMEMSVEANGERRDFLVSLRIIHTPEGEPTAYIATFRRIEQVRQLVNRLVGAQARLTLSDLVAHSPAMRQVRRQTVAAADAKACLLLTGESGTGKSALARAIHNSSRRAAGPFLAVNCRALPRELILGEFMGFEAGAFNAAHTTGQPSKFELVHGGTLYLEEVDALPLDMQAALLRVIEAGDVIRLGGTRVIPVDARLIASASLSLEQRVAEGHFRADLLFRLSSFVIHLPPLRERPADIPVLIQRSLDRLSGQLGRSLHLMPEAEAALLAYPWPGNVRELESVLERAALQSDEPRLAPEHLPRVVREPRVIVPDAPLTEPLQNLAEAERTTIQRALRACHGNVTQAAQVLGIGRTTLWRKLRELNLTQTGSLNPERVDLAPVSK